MFTGLLAIAVGCDRRPPANLLLISLDTTRADHCSLYGYHLPTTPALEGLGAQGAVFETTYSTTASTGPSHATLFTGVVPRRHGLLTNGDHLPNGVSTIAENLAVAGYQTAGIASSFVLDERFGLGRGFDVWEDDFDPARSSMTMREWSGHAIPAGFDRRADETTTLALNWLRNQRRPERPFFLFVHYFEPHFPYEPPNQWRSRFSPPPDASPLESRIALYDASIAFTDSEIGRLIDTLDELGMGADTLVIVTADHGEGLMDHKKMGHGSHLYEEAVRIPFLVRWPGVVPAGVRPTVPVSLVDLQPTILDLLNLDISTANVQGRSLVPVLRSESDLPEPASTLLYRGRERRQSAGLQPEGERLGIRSGRWKYITGGDEPAELYDLETDPEELTNRILDHPEVASRLHADSEAWLAADPEPPGDERTLTPDERRGLEALGYLQSSESGRPSPAQRPR